MTGIDSTNTYTYLKNHGWKRHGFPLSGNGEVRYALEIEPAGTFTQLSDDDLAAWFGAEFISASDIEDYSPLGGWLVRLGDGTLVLFTDQSLIDVIMADGEGNEAALMVKYIWHALS